MRYASNVLRWDGRPGHPEAHCLTATQPETGIGIWIRYAMVAPSRPGRLDVIGLTPRDPDGKAAYCYNSETASTRLHVYERARRVGGWRNRRTLVAPGHAHFEYGQRDPVPEVELWTK